MYTDEPFSAYRRHPWHGLEPIPEGVEPGIVRAYIEMLPSDTVKYELDKNTGFLMVDRPQRTTATPPALYGFIPRTYCAEEVAAPVSYTHLRAHETLMNLVCRLLLEKT